MLDNDGIEVLDDVEPRRKNWRSKSKDADEESLRRGLMRALAQELAAERSRVEFRGIRYVLRFRDDVKGEEAKGILYLADSVSYSNGIREFSNDSGVVCNTSWELGKVARLAYAEIMALDRYRVGRISGKDIVECNRDADAVRGKALEYFDSHKGVFTRAFKRVE